MPIIEIVAAALDRRFPRRCRNVDRHVANEEVAFAANGRVQLLTRTGLDWTDKYASAIAALANLNIETAYLDGELCGVDEAGLPTFAHIQAATDGERNVQLVYYAFDLLH